MADSLSPLQLPLDDKLHGIVIGGGLTTFSENITSETKQNILDAIMFARISANKKWTSNKERLNWYRYYGEVLASVGLATDNFELEECKAPGKALDELLMEGIKTVSTPEQLARLNGSLETLHAMPDHDEKLKLFSVTVKESGGDCQIYLCDQDPDGEVSVIIGIVYCTYSYYKKKTLFSTKVSESSKVYRIVQRVIFNSVLFEKESAKVKSFIEANK